MSEQAAVPLVFAPGWNQQYYNSRPTPAWDTHWRYPYISASHGRLMQAFGAAGYDPHFHQLDWNQNSFEDWTGGMADFAQEIAEQTKDKRVVVGGFSLGGLVGAQVVEKLQQTSDVEVVGFIGASVSRWCGEKRLRDTFRTNPGLAGWMTLALQEALCELKLARIDIPTQLYCGTEEVTSMRAFHGELTEHWPQAESIKPPCAHNILDESYLTAIEQEAGRLALHT